MGLGGTAGGITEYWFPSINGVPSGYVLSVVNGELVWTVGADLAGYVPYTGATTNVDLNTKGIGFSDYLVLGDLTGNTRGTDAIDIQTARSAVTQVASGARTLAAGRNNQVSASDSIAIGDGNVFSKAFSKGFGDGNTITATNATGYVFGEYNTFGIRASGYVIGFFNNLTGISGGGITAIGQVNTIDADSTDVFGSNNTVRGSNSLVVGDYNKMAAPTAADGFQNYYSASIGNGNYSSGQYQLTVGVGLANISSNTLKFGGLGSAVVVQNNSIGAGFENPNTGLHSSSGILASDITSLDAEKVTNGSFTGSATGWTLGTGWAYSSNAVAKNVDGTGTLSQNVSAVAGETYLVTFRLFSATEGTLTMSVGNTFAPTINVLGTNNGSFSFILKAANTNNLIFTPSNTSRFSIDDVSVKKITSGDIAALGGFKVQEGTANAAMGVATLVTGTKVVNTTKVTANSRILLTAQALGTVVVPTAIAVTARTAGTSFTITSANATDTSIIAWQIIEPA